MGAKITDVRLDTVPDEFMLRITPRGRIRKCRVLWRSGWRPWLGVVFAGLFPTAEDLPTGDVAREPTAP